MAAQANPSYYQSSRVTQQIEQTEHTFKLYMYQYFQPGNSNQRVILASGAPNAFGNITALDWAIHDAQSPTAKVVARAQGMALGSEQAAIRYFICTNINFTDERFKGSSLKLLGSFVDSVDDEWAIVGGSGEFSYAQGAVKYKVLQNSNAMIVRELNIRVLCQNMPPQKSAKKDGPAVGGDGGVEFDITEAPQRLESVTIKSGDIIDSIAFTYTDKDGKKQMSGPWGAKGGDERTIVFAPGETLTKVDGTTNYYEGKVTVTSLTFVTNLTTYETFGKGKVIDPAKFTLPSKSGENIVAFFGRAGSFLHALGVYTA
ncbi:jacalin-related lectin 9 [Lolium perenne]|uniref:jacalin-related lectin 9 n=1 Tax=Lolium perenne TaxID=4522 RepID=UPI0021EB3BE0|nr:jacalin-related lectin 9-like [Lolium perenne]